MIIALLAILKAGGAYLPLDPAIPASRLAFMVDDASLTVVISCNEFIGLMRPLALATVFMDRDRDEIDRCPATTLSETCIPGQLAYVLYTSGSTGMPKGVAVSHESIIRLVRNTNYIELSDQDVLLQMAPLAFDASTFEIWGALLNGAKLVQYPAGHFDADQLASLLRRWRISVLWLPAGLFSEIVDINVEALKYLRCLLAGGDTLSVQHVSKALDGITGLTFINGYGPTEGTTFSACGVYRDSVEIGRTVPIGRPIANTQIYVLDQGLQPAPAGVVGELYIGGLGLARGYWQRPALTAERFVASPHGQPGTRLYRTGDLARWLPNGSIEFIGRSDNQVKVRGFRIELGEIELSLSRNESISQSVVLLREDRPGQKLLVAYVVAAADKSCDPLELRNFLAASLPGYMIPAAIVVIDNLPLTVNGKVDRKALPSPQFQFRSKRLPRTEYEEVLARLVGQVLGVDQIGIDDNFFELGGDSIQSIKVVARANRAGIKLTVREIFEHQTIANLARVATPTGAQSVAQGAVVGEYRLTPVQHWYLDDEPPDSHHFNQAQLLRPLKTLSTSILTKAFRHLLRHHDCLRVRFWRTAGEWRQENAAPEENVPFEEFDLSQLKSADRVKEFEILTSRLQSSLDLSKGPLARFALIHLGCGDQRVLLIVHHLVVDGVSWRILLEDLSAAYECIELGEPVRLQAKTVSFKSWSEHLQIYAKSRELLREADFWRSVSDSGTVQLPVDYPGGENTSASARSIRVALDEVQTRVLLREVPEAYHTRINDALLASLAQALGDWTGDTRHLVALEGHGREDLFPNVDVSRTVGWFTSVYPVVLELPQAVAPDAALRLMKEQLAAIPKGGVGYGVLRYLAGQPLCPQPQLVFNYLGQFDQDISETLLFGFSDGRVGATRSARQIREYQVEVNGSVTNGVLNFSWSYSNALHKGGTIEGVAHRFISRLAELIEYCQRGDGGYTESDFPLLDITNLNR